MSVAVIISTSGTWEHLWRLQLVLESLVKQTEEPSEVVVVDTAGENDEVDYLVQEFEHQLPVTYHPFDPAERVFRASEARNAGVRTLTRKPDRLLFLDGDCVATNRLISTHSGYHPRYIVAGARFHIDPLELPDLTLAEVYRATTKPDNRLRHPETWETYECCYTCHLSLGYELFRKIGGFWGRMGFDEDRELSMRATRAGGQVIFIPEHSVYRIDRLGGRPTRREELVEAEKTLDDSLKLPGFLRV
jgi:GT2 family glycosyltransferase